MTFKFSPLSHSKPPLNLFLWVGIFYYLQINHPVTAQVVEDGTLPTGVNTENNLDYNVDGGEQRGDNLFHSFAEFSIPTGGSVFFNNALEIENIITRVTGSSISNIDGLIGNNGTTNLFLLNPNGIIFGENASLNIGGSFIGTTAESIVFEDGTEFSTKLDNSEPLLTVTVPLGLQFGSNPGDITNRANFSVPNPGDPTGQDFLKLGLTTAPGETLALLGGNITFDGGAVFASGGNIELGSVAENSFIALTSVAQGWEANYENVSQFRDIKLDNLASVDASGEGGGNIGISGQNIQLFNGSVITSNTLGALDGGAIEIQASDLVEINGSDLTGTKLDLLLALQTEIFFPLASQISSNTIGAGKGGNVEIVAQNLKLIDGGSISLQTLDVSPEPNIVGASGDLNIEVFDSIQLQGNRPVLGVGENAESKVLPSIGLDLAIEINLSGRIQVISFSNADGGDISLKAKSLFLGDGGTIATSPFSRGDAGNITLQVSDAVEISGTTVRQGIVSSSIAANTFAEGNAGNIYLQTSELNIQDGGILLSSTDTVGNAGDINVEARSIEISGFRSAEGAPSLISAQTDNGGNGGNIFINTDSLTISDRAALSVEGTGMGIPGNLRVNAGIIDLSDFARIIAGTEFQSGGNIQLNIKNSLTLKENSLISAQAFGDADGGNLDIEVEFLIANPNQNNDILATAVRGNGGRIDISGDGIFGIEEGSSQPPNSINDIDASSEFGVDGTVNFGFPNFNESDFATKKSYNAIDEDNYIGNNFCNLSIGSEYYVVGKGGIAISPDRDLIVEDSWADLRFFDREAVKTEETDKLETVTKARKIEPIQGWFKDSQGKIVLTANPSVAIAPHSPALPHPDCNTQREIGK